MLWVLLPLAVGEWKSWSMAMEGERGRASPRDAADRSENRWPWPSFNCLAMGELGALIGELGNGGSRERLVEGIYEW